MNRNPHQVRGIRNLHRPSNAGGRPMQSGRPRGTMIRRDGPIMRPPEVIQQRQPTYSCLEIAGHVRGCPICTKFYNNDRSLYIVTIVLLAVVSIILLKKIIEGRK